MAFSETFLQNLRLKITDLKDAGNSWDDIKSLTLKDYTFPVETVLKFFIIEAHPRQDDLFSIEDWESLVAQAKKDDKQEEFTMLSNDKKNDATIPTDKASQWVNYVNKLRKSGFTEDSISEIKNSVFRVLQKLDLDTSKENSEAVKGLVVGDVQSGKTANMAGLISMASDYGFNYFIVLSGTIESLRQQTADRLFDDVKTVSKNFSWNIIDNPSLKKSTSQLDFRWDNINLSNPKTKCLSVCLKQKSRITDFIRWIYSDENKAPQIKLLVIDDEADQASINTKDPDFGRTAINKAILELVDGFEGKKLKAVNYVSYTATPYANLLNEAGPHTLYPKDFIVNLQSGADYIGASKIFGLTEPEEEAKIDITRNISNADAAIINQIHKGKTDSIPKSLQDALDWFFISSCALRVNNFKGPVTMLIHTSHRKEHHKLMNKAIQSYFEGLKNNEIEVVKRLENLFVEESSSFTRQMFIDGMPNYSISSDNIKNYPSWSEIETQIKSVLRLEKMYGYTEVDKDSQAVYHKGFHIAVDNSSNTISSDMNELVRLRYPLKTDKMPPAPMFIVIGGNTLSRGLTLKGLISTYFCRKAAQGDSLLQMARWLGYRKNYEIYPRIWMNDKVTEQFTFLTQLNEELKEDLQDMAKMGKSPRNWSVRIKNSPKVSMLRITANNKQQSAQEIDLDYTGEKPQTTVFANNYEELSENITNTSLFLNSLSDPDLSKKSRMIWRNIDFEVVKNYLHKIHFRERSQLFEIDGMLEWYEKVLADAQFKNWSVVLSTNSTVKKYAETENPLWNIQGYAPGTVMRSRKNDISDYEADIGVLRAAIDELIDIPEITADELKQVKAQEILNTRKKYSYDRTPQLVIYRIDKQNITQEEFFMSYGNKYRQPLNLSADAIGIFIRIPGVRYNSNLARRLSIDLADKYTDENYSTEE